MGFARRKSKHSGKKISSGKGRRGQGCTLKSISPGEKSVARANSLRQVDVFRRPEILASSLPLILVFRHSQKTFRRENRFGDGIVLELAGGTRASRTDMITLLNMMTGAPVFHAPIPAQGRWFDTRKRSGCRPRVILATSPSRQSSHIFCTRALTPAAPRYFPLASLANCVASVPGGKTLENTGTKSKPCERMRSSVSGMQA